MTRRVVFTIIAGIAAAAGLLWIGGMAVAQVVQQSQRADAAYAVNAAATTPTPRATGTSLPTDVPVPSTGSTASAADPSATASPGASDDGFVPFAERLRPWRAGDHVVTLAQIHAFYAQPGRLNDADPTWYQEKAITASCMADKGWYYDPRSDAKLDIAHRTDPRPTPDPQAQLALGGNTGAGDAYRWQDAGCYGLAVHETGNDHNN